MNRLCRRLHERKFDVTRHFSIFFCALIRYEAIEIVFPKTRTLLNRLRAGSSETPSEYQHFTVSSGSITLPFLSVCFQHPFHKGNPLPRPTTLGQTPYELSVEANPKEHESSSNSSQIAELHRQCCVRKGYVPATKRPDFDIGYQDSTTTALIPDNELQLQ